MWFYYWIHLKKKGEKMMERRKFETPPDVKSKRFLLILIFIIFLSVLVAYCVYRTSEQPYQKIVRDTIKEMHISSTEAMYQAIQQKELIKEIEKEGE